MARSSTASRPAGRSWQRDDHAGQEIEPDQEPDIGKADVELALQDGADGRDGFELERHRCANEKQQSKYAPTTGHAEHRKSWGER